MSPKRFQMLFRSISLVAGEPVVGEFLIERTHEGVTGDLRDHTGGCDGKGQAVSSDDAVMRDRKITDGQTVDEAMIRQRTDRFHGSAHREMGCAEDVERIDFCDIGQRDGPDDRFILGDPEIEIMPLLRTQLFRIVEFRATESRRKNHRGCGNGTRERTASRFVDACDTGFPEFQVFTFAGQVGHTPIQNDRDGCCNPRLPKICVAYNQPSLPLARPTPVYVQFPRIATACPREPAQSRVNDVPRVPTAVFSCSEVNWYFPRAVAARDEKPM